MSPRGLGQVASLPIAVTVNVAVFAAVIILLTPHC